MRRIPWLIFAVLAFSLLVYAVEPLIFSECSATPENNRVVISWVTKSESGISKFLILRSSDDKTFSEVGSKMAKGSAGSYSFTDENVIFKVPQTFFYKIRAVKRDNTLVEDSESLLVNPNISSIFRTWGAIKAIFR
jgi:hypothetical protein